MADKHKRGRIEKLEEELAKAIADGDERYSRALANAVKFPPKPMSIGKSRPPQWTTRSRSAG